jgi:Tfp pilus assembly protein PilO
MRLKPTKMTIIMLSVVCGVIVLAAGTAAYFQNEQLTVLKTQLTAKEKEVQDGMTISRRKDQALEALKQDREQVHFLEDGVADAAYVPTLLKQLEDLAGETTNKVNSVRPQIIVQAPTKLDQRRDPEAQAKGGDKKTDDKSKKEVKPKEDPYTKLAIQVNMIGSYRSVQAFATELQRFKKIMAIERLSMVPYRDPNLRSGDRSDKLAVDMELTAFILKQKTPVKTPDPAKVASGGIN